MNLRNLRPASGRGRRRALPAFLLALAVVPLALAAPASGQAAELRLAGVSPAAASPAPGYPVPNDPGMVFYLQRSANSNTVVYAARTGADGALDRDDPLRAFWRRYNAKGEVKELSTLERRLAYGVRTEARPDGGFTVRFRAIPELSFVLEERPGGPVLTFAPEGQPIDLSHGYVDIHGGGLTPSVRELRLYGKRRSDGQAVQVVYAVSGGEVSG